MERESLEDRTLVSALDNAGFVVRFGSRRGAMDFCPNHDDATTSTSIYDFKARLTNTHFNFRGFCISKINMNSLQEASRIFKAFKKGGPSFGAWQVRTLQL
jgi:hypothetical protein